MSRSVPVDVILPAAKMDIFGEMHTSAERKRIEGIIKRFHKIDPYNFLLMEGAGGQVLKTKASKEKALKDEKWSIGPRDIELGIELGIPVIGIDVWDKKDLDGYGLGLTFSFRVRESKMCAVIAAYLQKGRIAVIVGDTHLRTVKTDQLGPPSPIWEKYKSNKDVVIHRSPIREIE